MPIRVNISTEGSFGDLNIKGTDRNQDIGLLVHVPKGKTVTLGTVRIENVFIPVIKTGEGLLKFTTIHASHFGGDCFNIRGSNVVGTTLICTHNTPTRPYQTCQRLGDESIVDCLLRYGERVYDPSLLKFEPSTNTLEGYHVDGIMQMYATLPDSSTIDPLGCISNIRIPRIIAKLNGSHTQGIMGSEPNRYTDIHLGTELLAVTMDGYPFHTVFNQLDNSVIGGGLESVGSSTVRIRCSKPTSYESCKNKLSGVCYE